MTVAETILPAAELEALATRALTAGSMRAADAAEAAHMLVLADLFGVRTHGVQRISQYLDRARIGGIDAAAEVQIEPLMPALLRVDGGNGIGPLVASRALHATMHVARGAGLAAAFVRGSNHLGALLPYCFVAATQGFASIIMSNAAASIAPAGGRGARLGNNPLGIGVPRPGGDPVILDMAMSVAARARIRVAAKAGLSIPPGWATDAEGRPTTDPVAALAGDLLAVGGHKGYGMALMIDLLAGVLAGAGFLTQIRPWDEAPEAPRGIGHVIILVDAARLDSDGRLAARVDAFRAILHATTPANPASPVRLPGEAAMARFHRQTAEGVAVADADLAQLRDMAKGP